MRLRLGSTATMALLAAFATLAVSAVAWRGFGSPAVYHDEASYLLQAGIQASGRWAAPAPPVPEFFEQYHVLVTPILASKYPPGHSLLLVPGVWLGIPGIVPLLLAAITAAVLVVTVTRRWGIGVAMAVWTLWLAAPLGLHFRSSYLSESTTAMLWVLGWCCLNAWWDNRRTGYLLTFAGLVGWMAITRPLTAVAFALPAAAVIVPRLLKSREWAALGGAAAAGVLVLSLLPISSHGITESWNQTPLRLYTAQYMPWDRIGFGLDPRPPLRSGPPDMEQFAEEFRAIHRGFSPGEATRTLARRARWLWTEVWGAGAALAAVLGIAGLACMDRRSGVAVAQALLLLTLYAFYAHHPRWNAYYLEALPVLCLIPVLGLITLRDRLGAAATRSRPTIVLAGSFALMALMSAASVSEFRGVRQRANPHRELRAAVAAASLPAVVFVRRSPVHSPHVQLVENVVDFADAPVILAHDLGDRNGALLARVPGRTPYLFDEQTGRLSPFAR